MGRDLVTMMPLAEKLVGAGLLRKGRYEVAGHPPAYTFTGAGDCTQAKSFASITSDLPACGLSRLASSSIKLVPTLKYIIASELAPTEHV